MLHTTDELKRMVRQYRKEPYHVSDIQVHITQAGSSLLCLEGDFTTFARSLMEAVWEFLEDGPVTIEIKEIGK